MESIRYFIFRKTNLIWLEFEQILNCLHFLFFLYILKDLVLKDVPTFGKIESSWFQNLKYEYMIHQVS